MKSLICCLDIETTGVRPTAVPWQLAAYALDPNHPGMPAVGEFHEFIQIPAYAVPHVEAYAMNLHAQKGRSFEWMQANGKPAHEVYARFQAWLQSFNRGRLLPAGHNAAGFDMPILNREALVQMGSEFKWHLDYHCIDTMVEAAWQNLIHGAPNRLNLDAVCKHWGVTLDKDAAHDAKVDAYATAEVLRRQWAGRGGK